MKKILLVEDNEAIQKGLKYSLEQEKFVVELASDVKTAKDKLVKSEFNLIILDVMLPDGSGFELCRDIKKNMTTPILFLTAKDEEQDVVNGFDLGADDYVVKPFRPRELISRINNILRRYEKEESNKLQAGNVIIDLDASRVYVGQEEIVFTALEYKILVLLFSNMGKTVTRENILDKIWDVAGNFVNDNTLSVYIKRLRDKLEMPGHPLISTVRGMGYRLEVDGHDKK